MSSAQKSDLSKIHVDHFIPWSFVKEDKLWNFVLSCPQCNTKKSNILPPQNAIVKVQERNRIIKSGIEKNILLPESTFIKEQFKNYDENLIPRLWQYAKFSGFKAMQQGYSLQSDFGNLKVAETENIFLSS